MILRRVGFYLVTAVVAITVNFFIPRLMPGNPALAVIGRIQSQESKQAIAALEQQYGVRTATGLWVRDQAGLVPAEPGLHHRHLEPRPGLGVRLERAGPRG
jgi:ABC-type microcin C transport system permease subunit YejB